MQIIEIGNILHKSHKLIKCGQGEPTLIIASIGTSSRNDSFDIEFKKALTAQRIGANAVTDHSFYGNIADFHRKLVENLEIIVSTVSCYEAAALMKDNTTNHIDSDYFFNIIKNQVLRGIDMITIHASFLRNHISEIESSQRVIPMTSKGGGIILKYLRETGNDNPYFERFDEILQLFKEYNVTISLGTSFRMASICDSFDDLFFHEIVTMGNLVTKAIEKNVNIMIEGLGHASLSSISTYINLAKKYCSQVPYRVLPMATDCSLGYDHISGAIAGSMAIASGADAITCMSRSEHIGLPSILELEEAVITSMIAAHCGEIVRLNNTSKDSQMSVKRWKNGCKGDWRLAIYPDGAREALLKKNLQNQDEISCSMCGEFCGIRSSKE